MGKHGESTVSSEMALEFDRALSQFRDLIDPDEVDQLQPFGPGVIYTALVTVWMLIHQRLHAGATLEMAVTRFLESNPTSKNLRIRQQTLSPNTGAYSRARTRLKLEITDWVANHIFESLISASPPTLLGRRVFLLDGTTIPLAPTAELTAAFPPASNQHGKTIWPIAQLLVAHELESGCAMLPEIGAMYGAAAVSEVEQAKQILLRLPPLSLLLADRNFGVFAVAYAAVQAEHEVMFRLTKSRFGALVKRSTLLPSNSLTSRRWKLDWTPTSHERKAHGLPTDAHVEVHLHEIVVSEDLTLMLVTTMNCESQLAADVYRRRQDIETDIRDVKVTLHTEELRAKSVDMLKKELAASIIAYNLVQQVRRLAAKLVSVQPRRLSFTGTWTAVRVCLLERNPWDIELTSTDWLAKFERALKIASQRVLPNRPNRSYPRQAHKRCSKSNSGKKKSKPKPPK